MSIAYIYFFYQVLHAPEVIHYMGVKWVILYSWNISLKKKLRICQIGEIIIIDNTQWSCKVYTCLYRPTRKETAAFCTLWHWTRHLWFISLANSPFNLCEGTKVVQYFSASGLSTDKHAVTVLDIVFGCYTAGSQSSNHLNSKDNYLRITVIKVLI